MQRLAFLRAYTLLPQAWPLLALLIFEMICTHHLWQRGQKALVPSWWYWGWRVGVGVGVEVAAVSQRALTLQLPSQNRCHNATHVPLVGWSQPPQFMPQRRTRQEEFQIMLQRTPGQPWRQTRVFSTVAFPVTYNNILSKVISFK